MKILCIDDDDDIVGLLDNVLSASGHQVTVCLNGLDGISIIQKEDYNLIFLDLRMPGLSGEDVIDTLDKEGLIAFNNIVVLSADNLDDEKILNFKQKGIKDALQKPIRLEKLLEVVKRFE